MVGRVFAPYRLGVDTDKPTGLALRDVMTCSPQSPRLLVRPVQGLVLY
jgi:hypothetical protein